MPNPSPLLLPDAGRIDLAPTPTPGPVARQARESDGSRGAQDRLDPTSSRLGRDYLIWVGMVVGLVLAVALVAAHAPTPKAASVLGPWLQTHLPARMARPAKIDLASLATATVHQRADATVQHDGYAPIDGGVLFTPETFSSNDGSYDLLVHFHGNVKVVVESAEVAKLNAVVAVINLGVGSGPYEQAYAVPGTYEKLLDEIDRWVAKRGLERPRLRRVAFSSWSAGYGAISTILLQRRGTDPLDAILVLDGIHCGRVPENPSELNARQLAPFAVAAQAAASREILFSITYSEIEPEGYVGTRDTAHYLLDKACTRGSVDRTISPLPPYLKLAAMHGAVSKRDDKRMEPFEEARVGRFHIRGFRGNAKGHHMAHLFQMGATLLPELTQRWSRYPGTVPSVGPIDPRTLELTQR